MAGHRWALGLVVATGLAVAGCGGAPAAAPAAPATPVSSAGAATAAAAAPMASAASASPSQSHDCSPTSSYTQAEWVQFCAGVDNSTASATPVVTEGSVTTADGAFVQYPDGLRVDVAGLTAKPREQQYGGEHPDFDTQVNAQVKFSNTGTTPVALADVDWEAKTTLLYGSNEYPATGWASGNSSPKRLMPGTNYVATFIFTLPKSGLSTLALAEVPDPSRYTPYTFTDVQTLLR